MNFQNTLEQTLLKGSMATALERLGTGGKELSSSVLRELGILGLMVAEEQGGSGLGFVEAGIALQEAGRKALQFPLAETILLAGEAISAFPNHAERILSGEAYIAAATVGGLLVQDGRCLGKIRVSDVEGATWIAARVDGHGIALIPVEKLDSTARTTIEPGVAGAELAVDLARQEISLSGIAHYGEGLAILRCAEMLGAAEYCFELGLAYLKDRSQFGKPIGANQALKHMAADTYLALENVRVAVEYAAAAMDAARNAPDEVSRQQEAEDAVRVMLAFVPRAAREIAEASIQFHGGIGLTWEYSLNRYLRRIIRIGMGLGSVAAHRGALIDQILRAQRKAQHPTPEHQPS